MKTTNNNTRTSNTKTLLEVSNSAIKIKIRAILIILILPVALFGQKRINIDSSISSQIEKNIFRIVLFEPFFPDYETNGILGINYERQIKKAFTLVGKVGVGVAVDKFGPEDNPYQLSFHFYSSIEGRYYFTLNRRLKKGKYADNFSCPYISLEENLITNSIALIDQTKKKSFKGSIGTFFNAGYQIQLSKLYLNASFGVRLAGKNLSTYPGAGSLGAIHGGIAVGYVFKNND